MPEPTLSTALLDQVGWTGLLIAGIRAEESRRPDGLIDDPLATALVEVFGDEDRDERTRWTVREGRTGEMADALHDYVAVRSRYVDDAVLEATDAGIRQVVLLGAGLDGRAHRMTLPDGTTIFELDTPEVLDAKGWVTDLTSLPLRTARRPVAVDLRGDWRGALAAQGHRADAPTLWVAEGLLYYLSRSEGDELMVAVAAATRAGGRFVAEYPAVDMASFFGLIGTAAETRHVAGFVRTGPEEAPETWLPRFGWRDVSAVPLLELLARHGRPAPPWAVRDDGATWWLADASRA